MTDLLQGASALTTRGGGPAAPLADDIAGGQQGGGPAGERGAVSHGGGVFAGFDGCDARSAPVSVDGDATRTVDAMECRMTQSVLRSSYKAGDGLFAMRWYLKAGDSSWWDRRSDTAEPG